ncbi:hypothetical protein GCM10018952_73080 [Streptosporangium vulgare]
MTDKPSPQDRLVAAAFGAGWTVVPRLPERLTAWAFRAAADRLWKRRGKSVLRLEANLARVKGTSPGDPAIRALSRDGMRSYFRYFHEVFRLPSIPIEEIVARMRVVGADPVYDNLARGRGVVLALPHMGQLGPGGRLVRRDGPSVHHGRRAAQARVAVPPLHRLPRGARHGGAAAHRR